MVTGRRPSGPSGVSAALYSHLSEDCGGVEHPAARKAPAAMTAKRNLFMSCFEQLYPAERFGATPELSRSSARPSPVQPSCRIESLRQGRPDRFWRAWRI